MAAFQSPPLHSYPPGTVAPSCINRFSSINSRIQEQQQLPQQQQQQHLHQASRSESPASILPGLPNAVALHCLAFIPRVFYPALKAVSRAWKEALSGSEIYKVRRELSCTESWIYVSFSPRYSDGVRNWFEAYDPVRNIWRPISGLPGLADSEMLKGFGCAGLDGRLYVIGGKLCTRSSSSPVETDLKVREDVVMYDCFANKWYRCASMSTPRVDFACTVCNGLIYVVGGRCVASQEKGVASAEVYNPAEDRWYLLPKMSTSRYKCVGVNLKDRVYVIGGFTSSEHSQKSSLDVFALNRSSVEIYDPNKNRWVFVKGMWQLDVPPYQIVNLEGQLYSSGDVLNFWKGHIELYDEELNMWKVVQGSRRALREDLKEEGLLAVRRYVTMAPIGKRLFFLEGYCRLVEHVPFCFDRVVTFQAAGPDDREDTGRWEAFEPTRKLCREICSHCCVVEA